MIGTETDLLYNLDMHLTSNSCISRPPSPLRGCSSGENLERPHCIEGLSLLVLRVTWWASPGFILMDKVNRHVVLYISTYLKSKHAENHKCRCLCDIFCEVPKGLQRLHILFEKDYINCLDLQRLGRGKGKPTFL